MNGYKKLLCEADREIAKCHRMMDETREANLKADYSQWVRRAMEAERTKTWIQQQLEEV